MSHKRLAYMGFSYTVTEALALLFNQMSNNVILHSIGLYLLFNLESYATVALLRFHNMQLVSKASAN